MKEQITILGAGHQGLAMAAHLSANGVECLLWNRTEEHIKDIIETRQIRCKGILNKVVNIAEASSDIGKVLCKTIMVATPSSAHRDLARLLARYVDESYMIILNPGRTFGALDFISSLKDAGCKRLPCLAETQTIIYTCRRDVHNSVWLYAIKQGGMISAVDPKDTDRVLNAMPGCIRENYIPASSYLQTTLSNVGMILHCVPILMNVGWIENEKVKFEYYYDGISPSIADVLERLDKERLAVASKLGCPVESVVEWLKRTYCTSGTNLYEHLQSNKFYRGIDAPKSIHHRYIEEDIPNGLVPLEDIGKNLGVETPITTNIIDFSCIVMKCDYRKEGRRFELLKGGLKGEL